MILHVGALVIKFILLSTVEEVGVLFRKNALF